LGEQYPELRQALLAVGVPVAAKTRILRELFALHPVTPALARLLQLMLEQDDVNELPLVVEELERRVTEYHYLIVVEVTTATPLQEAQEQALRDAIRVHTDRKVQIEPRVDPNIIGGIVARVGSRVFDGSVARHLERLKARLVAGETL
jgi:F-type H+-transporting ATPase subunit delta